MVEQLVLFKSLHAEIVLSKKKEKEGEKERNGVSGSRGGRRAAAVWLPAIFFRQGSSKRPDATPQSSSAAGAAGAADWQPDCDSEERAVTRGDAPQKGCQAAQRHSLMNWPGEESQNKKGRNMTKH